MRKFLLLLAGVGLLAIGFAIGVSYGARRAESQRREGLSTLADKLPNASGQPPYEDWLYPNGKKDAGGRILEGSVTYHGLATFSTTAGQYQLLTTHDSYDKVVAYYHKRIEAIAARRLGTTTPDPDGNQEVPPAPTLGSGCGGGWNNDVFAGHLHLHDTLQPLEPADAQQRPRGVRTALLGYRSSGYTVNLVVSRTKEEKATHILLTFDALSIVPEAAK